MEIKSGLVVYLATYERVNLSQYFLIFVNQGRKIFKDLKAISIPQIISTTQLFNCAKP